MKNIEKQLEANRRNATRHGLFAVPQSTAAHDKFTGPIIADLSPANAHETQIAQLIAEDHYRLNRIREIENGIFSRNNDPAAIFLEHSKELERLTLYESRISRNIQRNLAQLKSLQTERKAERARQMAEARLLAQVNLAQNLAYHPELDGFVFSAPEINAAIDRNNRLQLAKTALSASNHQTRQDPPPLTIGMPALQPNAF